MSNIVYGNNLIEPIFYAGFSVDTENVESSSSGGIFYELCKYMIKNDGVIYGAAQLTVTEVVHIRTTTLEEVKKLRRSKYLKSKMRGCFIQVKKDLDNGRKVLFSGVPCQIGALYQYLDKEYENLYTVEVVCHGMPLSNVFQKYVEERSKGLHGKLIDICFRDKSNGWKNNSIREYYEDGEEHVVYSSLHPVHSLYIKGINMEEKCTSCEYVKFPRVADITLADYWQYEGNLKKKSNDRGLSLIVINNEKGNELMNGIKENIYCEETTREMALRSCRHMNHAPLLGKSYRAFAQFLETIELSMALDICGKFGDVVLADELYKIVKKDAFYVMSVLQEDTQEVVYIIDESEILRGIVTFGSFVQSYIRGEEWVNYNFGKVTFSNNCIDDIAEVFARSEKILRVPVVDRDGKLLFEVRRTNGGNGKGDARKGIVSFLELQSLNAKCYYVKRPDLLQDYNYSEKQREHIEKKWSFPNLCENILDNEVVFREMLGDKYSLEYVEGLCKISPIIKKGKRYVHVDTASEYVNVIGGLRSTHGQPEEYLRTIHVYGRCGVFGYAVEDEHTLPSRLQFLVKEHKVRVVNHGTWGADDAKILSNLYWDIKEQVIQKGDIVLLYMRYLPYMDILAQLGVEIFDTTQPYHQYLEEGGMFYDIPGHMTAEGYEFIARYIHDNIKKDLEKFSLNVSAHKERQIQKQQYFCENQKELEVYINSIRKMLPETDFEKEKVGSIVMNCNPFTNGHKYLIETARKEVDILLIFVLEEDKSYFSYKDRMEMVKRGTAEMENVYVLPSGKFMISSLTFPEYFLKEQQQEVVINPALDVEIFGKYIAPEFNISVRFVGTEPLDKVTNQYNRILKKVLPEYGINLKEIERLQDNGVYITATEVRKLLNQKNYDEIKKYLSGSTWEYLYNNFML